MKRFAFVVALAVAFAIPSGTRAQQPPSPTTWNIDVSTDKLTDEKVLVATAQATVEGASSVYQLELRCSQGNVTDLLLSTFRAANDTLRPIQWDMSLSPKFGELVRAYRYRIDDWGADVALLKHTRYQNAGLLSRELRPSNQRTTWSPLLRRFNADDEANLRHNFGALVTPDMVAVQTIFGTLPKTRLLIADVFPDETVEFRFDSLLAGYRATIQNMCGLR